MEGSWWHKDTIELSSEWKSQILTLILQLRPWWPGEDGLTAALPPPAPVVQMGTLTNSASALAS